jgi:peptidoglycan/xylan/chitin deacetylase (PgdA/CDA1 family)
MPRLTTPAAGVHHRSITRILVPVLSAGLVLGACSCTRLVRPMPAGSVTAVTTAPTALPTPAPTPAAPPTPADAGAADTVTAAAETFVDQISIGDFAAQWYELAPEAQAMWPGQAARTAMLSAKFSGAPITAVTIGSPTANTTWYDPEDPDVSVADTWQFPVSVYFADPEGLSPPGVASLFDMTTLSLTYDETTDTALVVGEGPDSIDAPVIVPSQITARQVNVPIFMYHEIRPVPPESEAAQLTLYGWQVEVGLTTLPSQFEAEMAYAHSIGATSISLQHLADALLYGLPLPPHSFVITFDDGRISQWTTAAPVLEKYGFTAVFFPCTSLIGGVYGPQVYMTAAQLQSLASTGFSIGDHTLADNVSMWTASVSTLNKLTLQSKQYLETLTGQPIQFVAYSGPWPWTTAAQGGVQEAPLFATLHSFGYVGGLLDLRVNSDGDLSTALWQLPRVRIGLGTTTAAFDAWLS